MRKADLRRADLFASLVVFLVALPLCVGVAIASGVPAELGLVTGIVGGLVAGVLPGSSLQVSGPAAGLTVLVYEAVQTYGLRALGVLVLGAGLVQLTLGALRLGRWFRAVSVAQRGSGRGNDYQRQQQALQRAQEQRTRQAERERKAAETASKRQERERKAAYQEQQAEQAQVRTIGVEHEVEQLGQLLRDALVGDPPTTFERRRRTHTPTELDERPWSRPEPSPRWEEFAPPEPGGLAAVLGLGRKRYEAEVAEA
ncbi:SulP family inorganic anion transporter, partial [Streptomyces sp. NPDC057927]